MNEQRISIFGAIGVEVTAEAVAMKLASMDRASPLFVEINSEGGSVQDGVAIFNLLSAWPGGVHTEVIGWALSVASMILMAGGTRRMHETSLLMVHAPWVTATGNSNGLRQAAETLDQVAETMRRAYMKSGQPEKVVSAWLDGADHWFTSDQAVALGLVTEVTPAALQAATQPANAQACLNRVPSNLLTRIQAMIHSPSATQTAPSGFNAVQAETQRCAEISAALQPMAARLDIGVHVPSLLQACLQDPTCTPQAAKARVLDLMARGVTSAAGAYVATDASAQQPREFLAACSDVLLMRAGIAVKDPHPALPDVQRMSIVAMAERFLSMAGRSVSGMSKNEVISAALSTSDFARLLANTAGKSLRQGYIEAPSTHVGWTAEREVPDFKKQTLVALSEAPGLSLVPEGGEYKFGSLGDSASEFQLATFGRILTLTRQAIINDDLSAFTALPALFGAAARRLEADKVYALLQSTANLTDGLPLFHADRLNTVSTGTRLSLRELGVARAMMRRQKGVASGGEGAASFIDPQPRFLIVPVEMETDAEAIISSLVDYRDLAQKPESQWIRNLTLVADPRLDAVSSSAWYLAASPAQIEGIVRAYLMGEGRPHLEENDEFVRDASSYKTRLDFAVGVVDYRGLFKNPGLA